MLWFEHTFYFNYCIVHKSEVTFKYKGYYKVSRVPTLNFCFCSDNYNTSLFHFEKKNVLRQINYCVMHKSDVIFKLAKYRLYFVTTSVLTLNICKHSLLLWCMIITIKF